MPEPQEVSLETMDGGAVIERFDYELRKVLDNISDYNTKAEEVRSVTLTLKIKPSESRERAAIVFDVKSKLASIKPVESTFYLVERAGKLCAVEHNPKQERFAFQKEI